MIADPFDTRHDFTLRVGIFPTRVLRMMVGGAMGIDKWGAIEKDPARGSIFYKFQGIFSHENPPLLTKGPIVNQSSFVADFHIIQGGGEKATKKLRFPPQNALGMGENTHLCVGK